MAIKQRMPYWLYSLEDAALRPEHLPRGECGSKARACRRLRATSSRRSCSHRLLPLPDQRQGPGPATTTASAGSCCSPTCTRRTAYVLHWTDNRLTIDWPGRWPGRGDRAVREGGEALPGRDRPAEDPRTGIAAYDLVAEYVTPHPASTWARGLAGHPGSEPWAQVLPLDGPNKGLVDLVLSGRVPAQHVLRGPRRRSCASVITSTRGITAQA